MVSANNRGERGPLNGCVRSSCFPILLSFILKKQDYCRQCSEVMIVGTKSEKRFQPPANSQADSTKEAQSLLLYTPFSFCLGFLHKGYTKSSFFFLESLITGVHDYPPAFFIYLVREKNNQKSIAREMAVVYTN